MPDHLHEFEERPGPPVGEPQGHGTRDAQSLVGEMDVDPVDLRLELRASG